MNTFVHVPPGFRFHPTDEELVDYYLRRKVASMPIDLDVIKEVDLYKIEPWDLQEVCKMGAEEQNNWYFFSHKDKKYPTGTRTNRATGAGFWKATGRDKAIYYKNGLIGMRKTLVFYKGRAPNGQKSDWIMHEYRLETSENGTPQEEGWVVCRVFKKRMTAVAATGDHQEVMFWENNTKDPFSPDLDSSPSSTILLPNPNYHPYKLHYAISQQQQQHPFSHLKTPMFSDHHHQQQQHTVPIPYCLQEEEEEEEGEVALGYQQHEMEASCYGGCGGYKFGEMMAPDLVTDWRVLDKFVASQLSHGDASSNDPACSNSEFYGFCDDDDDHQQQRGGHTDNKAPAHGFT